MPGYYAECRLRSNRAFAVLAATLILFLLMLSGYVAPASVAKHDASPRTGFSGDRGPAIAAQMVSPSGLAVDRQGNLYISDSYDSRIRKVDAKSGMIISTVAGNGSPIRQDIRTVRPL